MKNCFKYLALFALLLGVGMTQVSAASCPTSIKKEISLLANYVKIDYEVEDNSTYKTLTVGEDETEYKIPNYTFVFSIYNIVPEIFVNIQDNTSGTSMNITNDMTEDGTYTFRSSDFGTIHNYVLTVKSANEECYGAKFRTIKQTQPRYNAYSEYTYCKNSSSYYCQKFIGTELNLKNTDDFLAKIKVNNENNSPDKDSIAAKEEIKDLLKDNWKTYLLIFGALLIVISASIIFIKKYQKKKGWRL